MNMGKTAASIIITAMVVMAAFTGAAAAKSLYVIEDCNTYFNNAPVSAYDIQGTGLVHQATFYVPGGWGAVGLTIDTDSETLFITHEGSSVIEKINAKTMTSAGNTTVENASNLAGIVVDQDKGLVYAVDRGTHNLSIYNLSLVYQSTKVLPNIGGNGLYGIALDETNDLLYVTEYSPTVRYYDTTNWMEQGNFTVSHNAIGIAVDAPRQIVYTVAGYARSNLLSKYDLGTATETTTNMSHGGMGIAVDPATGLVYVTGGYNGDDLSVWDPVSMSQTNSTDMIGDPTGVCVPGKDVGYNPLNLTKVDDVADDDCVDTGDTITYTICYDSLSNQYDVHNVTIVDTLPANVSFVSATGGGMYSPDTVTWDIGTVTAGAQEVCVTLTVRVNAGAENTTLTNCAEIDGDEVGPTHSCVDTDVCKREPRPTPTPYPKPIKPASVPVPAFTPPGITALIGLLTVVGYVVLRRRD